jgi:hypothetical protein
LAECIVVCVEPSKVEQVWPFVAHLIKSAMTRGGMSDFASVEQDVKTNLALLWLVWDGEKVMAAAVTQINTLNDRKIYTIVACGGEQRERWLFLISKLEEHARDEGCARVRICGRRGWTKALEGYRVRSVILEKESLDGRQINSQSADGIERDQEPVGTDD